MASDERERLLRDAAERFNAGDLEAVVELFDPMVEWPDLLDDKLIWGRRAVLKYWRRQLLVADPHLTPIEFVPAGEDLIMVITQRVGDRVTGGELIPTMVIAHRYSFREGLVSRMRFFRTVEEALAADDSP